MKRSVSWTVVVVSLLVIGTLWAQQGQVSTTLATAGPSQVVTTADGKMIVTGADVGVRIDERGPNGIRGTLMVRIDGQWQEVDLSAPPAQ